MESVATRSKTSSVGKGARRRLTASGQPVQHGEESGWSSAQGNDTVISDINQAPSPEPGGLQTRHYATTLIFVGFFMLLVFPVLAGLNDENHDAKSDQYHGEVEPSHDCDPILGCGEKPALGMALLVFVLILCIFTSYFLSLSRFRYLPESVAVVLVGMMVGLSVRLSDIGIANAVIAFKPGAFFLFLLPPIILEAGWSLEPKPFFGNIGTICVYAVFGTVLSSGIVAGGLLLMAKLGLCHELPLLDALVFGALISAIDPVATLSIFQSMKVDQLLHVIVFGESVLNDAVSVVLVRTFLVYQHKKATPTGIIASIASFLWVSFGSVAIAVVMSGVAALMFKLTRLRDYPALETSAMIFMCYLPYLLADGIGCSGIMAAFFAGVLMKRYAYANLSRRSRKAFNHVLHVLAFVSETAVFVYIGMAVFAFRHTLSMSLVLWTAVLCIVGRCANIGLLTPLVNKFRATKIPSNFQYMMTFSGLRGGIAFALSMRLDSVHQDALVTTTLATIMFTMLFMGGFTYPALWYWKIPSLLDGEDVPRKQPAYNSFGWFERLDRQKLQPIFRHRAPPPPLREPVRSLVDSSDSDGVGAGHATGRVSERTPLSPARSNESYSRPDSGSDDEAMTKRPLSSMILPRKKPKPSPMMMMNRDRDLTAGTPLVGADGRTPMVMPSRHLRPYHDDEAVSRNGGTGVHGQGNGTGHDAVAATAAAAEAATSPAVLLVDGDDGGAADAEDEDQSLLI